MMVMAMVVLTGCPGSMEVVTSRVSGAAVEEVRTKNLICGRIQFGERVSISCVKKGNG